MEKRLRFRPNVGLMIINKEGNIWLGTRANSGRFHKKYQEQMPQGGIDAGEKAVNAAFRELSEETGLKKEQVKLLKKSFKWYSYTFPQPISWGDKTYDGQRQKWFLFLHTGSDADFNLNAHPEEIEFSSFSWCPPDQVTKRVIPFKRGVYRRVIKEFMPIIKKIYNQNIESVRQDNDSKGG